ncbi:MAG TPA: O-antigen ligase family protein [Beijerinckiaceae bacterium]|nr:O-antigen ligase family protein [Beijerinckiaceae bacterium]
MTQTTTSASAAEGLASARSGLGHVPVRRLLERIAYALFAVAIAGIGIAFTEPSPYDLAAVLTILLWLLLGLRFPRGALLFLGLLLIYQVSLFAALIPHLDDAVSVVWTALSAYLMITAIFFVMFFSEETDRRVELALRAFTVSCVVAAVAGIMGYFDILNTGALFTRFSRASGTFKDPNVLGSFLILGVLYLSRDLLTGEGRRPLLRFLVLAVLMAGIFLSFSRGSWAATALAVATLVGLAWVTVRAPAVRRRIAALSLGTALIGTVAMAGLLSVESVREMLTIRAQVTQDYDEGETGRFGNQLRAIPMLLEEPNGFGPLRFRIYFGFEPHNTYLGGFANGGWLAGLSFLGLVLATTYVGFRLALRPSPFQRHGQIVAAANFVLMLQAAQIDVDHWRHVFLIWGLVWGLEGARVKWLAAQRRLRIHGLQTGAAAA